MYLETNSTLATTEMDQKLKHKGEINLQEQVSERPCFSEKKINGRKYSRNLLPDTPYYKCNSIKKIIKRKMNAEHLIVYFNYI